MVFGCVEDLKIALAGTSILSRWKARVAGFSIVELIAVLIVVGLIVSVASSRLAGGSFYDALVAKDATLLMIKRTQQIALSGENVSFAIVADGTNVIFSQIISGAVSTTSSFPSNEVAITAGTVGSGTSCSSITSTITLNFDSAGEIETVDDDGFPICLNGESSLCISPAGFAHEGACL